MAIGTPRNGTIAPYGLGGGTQSAPVLGNSNVPYPTGVALGDYLEIAITARVASTTSVDYSATGWFHVKAQSGTNTRWTYLYKIAEQVDVDRSATTTPLAVYGELVVRTFKMSAVSGVDPANPIDGPPTIYSTEATSSTVVSMASQTPTISGAMLRWGAAGFLGTSTWTPTRDEGQPNPNAIEWFDMWQESNTGGRSGAAYWETWDATTPTGSRGATPTTPATSAGVYMVLRPATTGTTPGPDPEPEPDPTEPTPPPGQGLVAHWDFAQSAPPFTTKAGVAPFPLAQGTGSTVTKVADGPLGNAIELDGTTDYLIIPAANVGALDAAQAGDQVTVAAWVKRTDANQGYIAGLWNEGQELRNYGLFLDLDTYGGNNQVCGHISYDGGPTAGYPYSRDYSASARELRTDGTEQWRFVAMTYDGAAIRSYLDGQMDSRPTFTDNLGNTYSKNPYPYTLGLNHIDAPCDFTVGGNLVGSTIQNLVAGRIGGLWVYNRALSSGELVDLQRSTLATGTPVISFDFWSPGTGAKLASTQGWRSARGATGLDSDLDTKQANFLITELSGQHFLYRSNSATENTNQPGIGYYPTFAGLDLSEIGQVSFRLNNSSTADVVRFVVRVGTTWYASEQAFNVTTAGSSGGNWTTAETKTFVPTRTGSTWRALNFVEGFTLALGSIITTEIPDGPVTAIGFFNPSVAGVLRIDDVAVTPTAYVAEQPTEVHTTTGMASARATASATTAKQASSSGTARTLARATATTAKRATTTGAARILARTTAATATSRVLTALARALSSAGATTSAVRSTAASARARASASGATSTQHTASGTARAVAQATSVTGNAAGEIHVTTGVATTRASASATTRSVRSGAATARARATISSTTMTTRTSTASATVRAVAAGTVATLHQAQGVAVARSLASSEVSSLRLTFGDAVAYATASSLTQQVGYIPPRITFDVVDATLTFDGASDATIHFDGASDALVMSDGEGVAVLAPERLATAVLLDVRDYAATLAANGESHATLDSDGVSSATLHIP